MRHAISAVWLCALLLLSNSHAAQLPAITHPQDIYSKYSYQTFSTALKLCEELPQLTDQLGLHKWAHPAFSDVQALADSISAAYPDFTQDIELVRVATFVTANMPKMRLLSMALFLNWQALETDRDAAEDRINYVRQKFCLDTPK